MLEKCKDAKERWGGVSELIDRWLHERQELLGLFVALPQKRADENVAKTTKSFCQILMDYVSSGHFEVYEHLLAEAGEFNDGGTELAQELYPKIQNTTDIVLSFDDQYSTIEHLTVQDITHLSEHLSKLGEALAERFEMEDQLIETLHNVHKDKV
jgi:regulator of sigma D